MADFDFSRDTNDERLLLIAFNNERPMSAAQVASVLRALDSDYKNMTGRDLVLGHMELGSVWIWLMDAAIYTGGGIIGTAAVAKAVEELAGFAKRLRDGFKDKQKLPSEEWRIPAPSVDKSLLAIAKASIETRANFRIKHTRESTNARDTIEIEVTPAEASETQKRVKNRPKTGKAVEPPKLISTHMDIQTIAQTMRELPPATGDIESVIRALVQAHMLLGSTYVLEQVAATLEFEGRSDIAMIIRQMLGKDKGLVHVEV
ncbi:hypothetical protein [Sinorhizobium sp. KGO-5]|uniref:hypothetical protein n=1 Tax=Sinorhizobium sp. KGO-5 TaxID=1470810 RepID=UPI0030C686EC